MSDALIVTTQSNLREIIRDAVSEAVARYERIPELLSTKGLAARLDVIADTVRKRGVSRQLSVPASGACGSVSGGCSDGVVGGS